jgi:hypothetical protein
VEHDNAVDQDTKAVWSAGGAIGRTRALKIGYRKSFWHA